jgi:RNA polymerase sigma factor (TIGR02999 family)
MAVVGDAPCQCFSRGVNQNYGQLLGFEIGRTSNLTYARPSEERFHDSAARRRDQLDMESIIDQIAGPADEVYLANPQADDMSDATVMLAAIEAGDPTAAEQLLALVYDELRRLAASKLAREDPGQTLQPTALVHEVWLNLVGNRNPSFKDRAHFFRASAEAMRHILIDRARRKKTVRHGGGYRRIDFEGFDMASPSADDQVLAINEALDKLATEHPVQAEVVQLRYFGGLTNAEVSDVLGVSLSTVKNYWAFSRAWLLGQIECDEA